MRKLELKDICGYLPYGLYLQIETNDGIFVGQFNGYDNNGNISISLEMRCAYGRIEDENIKPYLYSMDWLTKPITHKGETFVPIVELKDMFNCIDLDGVILFSRIGLRHDEWDIIFDKLSEWHFDFNGLLDAGLAIPVTNEFNPYKL